MVHKSSLIPGLSKFIDENILAHYPPTSMKRILMAGAVSLYLKKGSTIIDSLMSNPIFTTLGVVDSNGMIDVETMREVLKQEVSKAGCIKLNIPFVGEIDFTSDDVESLYRLIKSAESDTTSNSIQNTQNSLINGGVY
jgi:hypothetical protein